MPPVADPVMPRAAPFAPVGATCGLFDRGEVFGRVGQRGGSPFYLRLSLPGPRGAEHENRRSGEHNRYRPCENSVAHCVLPKFRGLQPRRAEKIAKSASLCNRTEPRVEFSHGLAILRIGVLLSTAQHPTCRAGWRFIVFTVSRRMQVSTITCPCRTHLAALTPKLSVASERSGLALKAAVRAFAEATEAKLDSVAEPRRAAPTGRSASPAISNVLTVLGRDQSLGRDR